jgi:hypothetical protein
MARKNLGVLESTGALCVALSLVGCNDFSTADAAGQLSVPSRADFPAVADAMQLHCGTLDCHGQAGRNMRLYGLYGLRLDPTSNPLGEVTSEAEYDATYSSIVGLEPEIMTKVVQHQVAPETLTMLRKPLGIEKHMGGVLIVQDDPLDRCMVGWLTGEFDSAACIAVVQAQRPEPPPAELDASE